MRRKVKQLFAKKRKKGPIFAKIEILSQLYVKERLRIRGQMLRYSNKLYTLSIHVDTVYDHRLASNAAGMWLKQPGRTSMMSKRMGISIG